MGFAGGVGIDRVPDLLRRRIEEIDVWLPTIVTRGGSP